MSIVESKENLFLNGVSDFCNKNEFVKVATAQSMMGIDGENTIQIAPIMSEKDRVLPVDEFAYESVQSRAGISGPALQRLRMVNWGRYSNHMNDYYRILNKNDVGLAYIHDGELIAMHSEKYTVIPTEDVINETSNTMNTMFPDNEFEGGAIDKIFSLVRYKINDNTVTKAYADALGYGGATPRVTVVTSDAGCSAATIYPMVGHIIIGKPMRVEHKGEGGIEKFRTNLAMLFSKVLEGADMINELGKVKIEYPQQCFLNIAERIGLPKQDCLNLSDDLALEFGRVCTARDIYSYFDGLFTDSMEEKRSFALADNISRALTLDFKKFDTGFCRWLKTRSTLAASQTKLW